MLSCMFSDTIFLSSFLAVTLICVTTALWGTILLISKQPLLSESLSHASYPGLLIGALIAQYIFPLQDSIFYIVLFGCVTSILGYGIIVFLGKVCKLHKDAALCFVLVMFFALGVILASYVKDCNPAMYNRINAYLYGQAATLGFFEAGLAAVVFCASLIVLWLWYREIIVTTFDKDFAFTCGVKTILYEVISLIFVSLVIVSGVRSVGIVLISAMFVAPSLGARQLSDRLSTMLVLSACFGGISGALGSYISVAFGCHAVIGKQTVFVTLPTGPLVVVCSGVLACMCLLFSPKYGWVTRTFRKKCFSFSKHQEHLLKIFWHASHNCLENISVRDFVCSDKYQEYFGPKPFPTWRVWILEWKGYVIKESDRYRLTEKGKVKALGLVRAHRLWESYLVHSLDFSKENVHELAEEIEHVLTEELDNTLTEILNNPFYDPHQQIIPDKKREE
ncbi:Manganese transport system membrane protein mntB,high-affinity zinc transporter membrane component,anchored repeat-type ABC transporter, permease subunit,ABC 3 transport family [Chlamydia serpentis]|uniref:Manganese transport system membrane protein mntB,high-affinity zinc transporter membrane component,anchored repeat-type ABC transporter, permease subunit,ABC 3 transport family n=1 Tax=Chlamydia serpentis TaxID=1967782 RepID=A0A2R8FB67_9CHLA|nr:iron chelate uptake ABC transporter family permease subunit [Chlamydia serpentis]SPN73487.1 Manganese transport system membrane protein mntB,high-affinity zinc transporter membrane component,anchored repeat-type ABC transporter, permease subunit,ABC 3 transport family [Chlamydia serpentis]